MSNDWLTKEVATQLAEFNIVGVVHIVPLDDIKQHDDVGFECECRPLFEKVKGTTYGILKHNSFDGREYAEQDNIKYREKQ